MANILILGSGGFGAALAVMLHKSGHQVSMWSKFQQELDEIRLYGEHRRLLPGIPIDTAIRLTSGLEDAAQAELAIIAVPSFAVRETARALAPRLGKDTVVANVGKGFEEKTLLRLSQVIREEIPENDIVVLSGPSHAEEIARNVPTTIVAACANRAGAEYVQDLLMNTNLRVYVSDDMVGVELGGALKNIIAICAGVCDGLGLGDNTKAALMTRGLAEIARLGAAMGAQAETFAGLTGMGDLIVTCTSMHSRNRRAGIFLGQGLSPEEALSRVGMTVEGIIADRAAYALAQRYGVEMPIVEQLYQVITQGKEVRQALADLMGRPRRHENEHIWLQENRVSPPAHTNSEDLS